MEKQKRVTLRISEELYGKLKFISEAEERSVNKQITLWMVKCVECFENKYGEIWL